MEPLLIPQLKNAYQKTDSSGHKLLESFQGNLVQGIKIKKYEGSWYFEIMSTFNLNTYGNLLKSLVSPDDFQKITIYLSQPTKIEEIYSDIGNRFQSFPSDYIGKYIYIEGDIYSIYTTTNPSNACTHIELTNSLDGKMRIHIVCYHTDMAMNDFFIELQEELKPDDCVGIYGKLSFSKQTGQVELKGQRYTKLPGKSRRVVFINEQRQIWKTIRQQCLSSFCQPDFEKLPAVKKFSTVYVISPKNSQGFGDFKNYLFKNYLNKKYFKIKLNPFPTPLTPKNLATLIQDISKKARSSDYIAIIRGGGNRYDFLPFEDANLAKIIAQCPIPIILGLGHIADSCLCEQAASLSCGTPTAAAKQLVNLIYKSISKPSLADLQKQNEDLMNLVEEQKQQIAQLQEENAKLKKKSGIWGRIFSLFSK